MSHERSCSLTGGQLSVFCLNNRDISLFFGANWMFAEEEKTATGKKYPPEKEKVPSEKRAEKKEISRFEFSPEIFFLYQYFLAARGNKEEYNCQLLCSIRTYSGPVSEL